MRLLFIFFALTLQAKASTISGKIVTSEGNPLPFSTIYVSELKTGTAANQEGDYSISLQPGTYTFAVQYMGYKTLIKTITIGSNPIFQDFELEPRSIMLKQVNVKASNEDPAYTVMRKAIAKSKFHLNQVDAYSAKVYMKGTGGITKTPFFLRKVLKEEGIDENRRFISESISEVSYKRPNTYNEKVISLHSDGEDNETGPNQYLNGSFYEPKLAGAVSPLSPKAFAYYRFEYEGIFNDRGYEVNKIKVTPRSKGDDVFTGHIYIIEDNWSIHSLDLEVGRLGIKFEIEQFFAPIDNLAWMPISHNFKVQGSFMGLGFEYDYLATVSDYVVTLNPEIPLDIDLVDVKIEKKKGKVLSKQEKNINSIQEQLAGGEEVTLKQVRKLAKEYEKQEFEDLDIPNDVVTNRTYIVDSMAHTTDSVYWTQLRPVPLTSNEKNAYIQLDSIVAKQKADTTNSGKSKRDDGKSYKGFQLRDLVLGDTYRSDSGQFRFSLNNIFKHLSFNTVEGFNSDYGVRFWHRIGDEGSIRFDPMVHYSIARNKTSGKANLTYRSGGSQNLEVSVNAGRFISQFNSTEPIHHYVNAVWSLFGERNYMKVFEQDIIQTKVSKKFSDKYKINVGIISAQRRVLSNESSFKIINWEKRDYTSNTPTNRILDDFDSNTEPILSGGTLFSSHRATTMHASIEMRPWLKYRIRNGRKSSIDSSSPILNVSLISGSPVFDSESDFSLAEVSARYDLNWGVRGILNFRLTAGTFLNSKQMYFPDFKHFAGNKLPFTPTDPVGSFRMLDCYQYSSNRDYLVSNVNFQFRKFLFTNFFLVRQLGIRENVLVNFLASSKSKPYAEIGYSIDYILKIFRVEAIAQFENYEYKGLGFFIGVAGNLENLFDFD